MERLCMNRLKKDRYYILQKLYSDLQNTNNTKYDIYKYIISYLIKIKNHLIKESSKFDDTEYSSFKEFTDNIAEYQDQGGTNKADNVFIFNNFNLDIVKKYLPEAIKQATCYRAIILKKDDIDKNDIENSIRKLIHFNNAESWTTDKKYADSLENSLLQEHFNPKTDVMVRLKANITGLYLPGFWELLEDNYYKNTENEFYEDYHDIAADYAHEKEMLTPTPSNYEIYNLDKIKEVL